MIFVQLQNHTSSQSVKHFHSPCSTNDSDVHNGTTRSCRQNFSMDVIVSNKVIGKTFNGTLSISATLLAGRLNLALYFDGATQASHRNHLYSSLRSFTFVHIYLLICRIDYVSVRDRIEIYSQKQYVFQKNKPKPIVNDRAKWNPY